MSHFQRFDGEGLFFTLGSPEPSVRDQPGLSHAVPPGLMRPNILGLKPPADMLYLNQGRRPGIFQLTIDD